MCVNCSLLSQYAFAADPARNNTPTPGLTASTSWSSIIERSASAACFSLTLVRGRPQHDGPSATIASMTCVVISPLPSTDLIPVHSFAPSLTFFFRIKGQFNDLLMRAIACDLQRLWPQGQAKFTYPRSCCSFANTLWPVSWPFFPSFSLLQLELKTVLDSGTCASIPRFDNCTSSMALHHSPVFESDIFWVPILHSPVASPLCIHHC